MDILVTKDNKGKTRVVEISYEWDDAQHGFVIRRKTYQYGGKVTVQPEIWIYKGKVKRTVSEQARLEYNSHLKKYTDKGYKLLPSSIKINNAVAVEAFVEEHLGNGVTDSNGFKKHMLAKQADKVATSVFDKIKYWYGSRKIDGVRCSFYWKDGEVRTASRGGGDYDASTSFMRHNPKLIQFFEEHPDIVLDGELYKHGKSLQQISGAARLEKDTAGMDWLEYYIYDVMDSTKTFEERLDILHDITDELNLGFNPEREWDDGELKFQIVPQETVVGWANIQKLHDKYVGEGFEGIVIRDPSKVYNFGGRTNAMIKVKMYKDAEFEIVGYSEGLRPEDMVFVCKTKEGKEFEAKPMGPRELKWEYLDRMDEIIGKMATVKYFYLSDEGCPLQPVLKCIRDYE
jgi:DNA ligase-1|nr:MAG: NAD-dependent DNA ligase adenylation domain [Bacteriophage sp.]UWG00258.1 MAG: NAD-dependent DNA ligase adenylation domain [Bacteriophage sp.]DAT50203.1 MAG TPA: adenylation DNA ligase-like protein [Caudoviricetes sp.]